MDYLCFPFSILLAYTIFPPFQYVTPTVFPSCLNTSLRTRFVPDNPSCQAWVPPCPLRDLLRCVSQPPPSLSADSAGFSTSIFEAGTQRAFHKMILRFREEAQFRSHSLFINSTILMQNGFIICKPNFRWYIYHI